MQKVLNVKVALEITTTDGQPFFSAPLQWNGVPYEHAVAMEKILIGALSEITKLGDAQAAAIKAGG